MNAAWDLLKAMYAMFWQLAESPLAWVPCLILTFGLALVGLDRVLRWVINFNRFQE